MYDATELTVLVLFGVGILFAEIVARRTGVNGPVLLILVGVGLGFLPTTAAVRVPPELVVLLFLPALLYWEALTTSVREIWNDFRSLVLSSVFLVLATAGAVAVLAHGALGLSWPVAFVLGAIVAPTDATAVAAVARGLPRRQLTMLRAESLVNDGTALVLFGVAVTVATGADGFRPAAVLGAFALSYAGGVAVGVLVAWLAVGARRVAGEPLVQNVVSLLTPFVAFLLAEEVHASGVLAVVVCGLLLTRLGPRVIRARTRVQAHGFWQIATFVLNAALFLLVGLQLPAAVRELSSRSLAGAVAGAALIVVGVVVTRVAWMIVVPFAVRALDRRAGQRARRIPLRERLPLGWAGFRGAVSLAIALAVPVTTTDGSPFPERDLLLVITFGVILMTLVGQGLTLPAVIRFARYGPDTTGDTEIAQARERLHDAALARLSSAAQEHGADDDLVSLLRTEHERRRSAGVGTSGAGVERERRVRLAVLEERRRVLLRLRDDAELDDRALLLLQAELDNEELGITGGPGPV